MRWEFNIYIRTRGVFSILRTENICYLFKLGFRVPLYEMESENWGKPQPHHSYPKIRVLYRIKP